MDPGIVIGLALTAISVIGIPLVTMLVRGSAKWTRVEAKLDNVIDDVRDLVINKDQVHLVIMQTIKDDRAATDKRLRWLEEFLWKRGNGRAV